nr:lipase family protein [Nocardia cyriacigeorgica]
MIRTEPVNTLTQIPGVPGMWPGDARRILYSSQTQDGTPVAVSGTIFEPTFPWRGAGERPTVVFGHGTYGSGDHCAGSRNPGFPLALSTQPALSLALNYEEANEYLLLSLGIRVISPDLIGFGTPGVHTYVNRVDSANAMIDAARAALRLSNAPADAPVGFWGYSQGGNASATAAEMVGSRAPELNVKGTYTGAPPADLYAVLEYIDGTMGVGAIGYAVNGLIARYPELGPIIDSELNDNGKRFLSTLANQCFIDSYLTFGKQRTSSFTKSGKSFAELTTSIPALGKAVDEQRIGRRVPNAPVLVHWTRADDAIPAPQDDALARDWCALGASVVRSDEAIVPPILPGVLVNHVLGALTGLPLAVQFMVDRFNGAPLTGSC